MNNGLEFQNLKDYIDEENLSEINLYFINKELVPIKPKNIYFVDIEKFNVIKKLKGFFNSFTADLSDNETNNEFQFIFDLGEDQNKEEANLKEQLFFLDLNIVIAEFQESFYIVEGWQTSFSPHNNVTMHNLTLDLLKNFNKKNDIQLIPLKNLDDKIQVNFNDILMLRNIEQVKQSIKYVNTKDGLPVDNINYMPLLINPVEYANNKLYCFIPWIKIFNSNLFKNISINTETNTMVGFNGYNELFTRLNEYLSNYHKILGSPFAFINETDKESFKDKIFSDNKPAQYLDYVLADEAYKNKNITLDDIFIIRLLIEPLLTRINSFGISQNKFSYRYLPLFFVKDKELKHKFIINSSYFNIKTSDADYKFLPKKEAFNNEIPILPNKITPKNSNFLSGNFNENDLNYFVSVPKIDLTFESRFFFNGSIQEKDVEREELTTPNEYLVTEKTFNTADELVKYLLSWGNKDPKEYTPATIEAYVWWWEEKIVKVDLITGKPTNSTRRYKYVKKYDQKGFYVDTFEFNQFNYTRVIDKADLLARQYSEKDPHITFKVGFFKQKVHGEKVVYNEYPYIPYKNQSVLTIDEIKEKVKAINNNANYHHTNQNNLINSGANYVAMVELLPNKPISLQGIGFPEYITFKNKIGIEHTIATLMSQDDCYLTLTFIK